MTSSQSSKLSHAAAGILAAALLMTSLSACSQTSSTSAAADNASASTTSTISDAESSSSAGSGSSSAQENAADTSDITADAADNANTEESSSFSDTNSDSEASSASDSSEDYGTPLEVPEGQYLSELTGLPINLELQDQRPIAVMVDNESKALPHYGTADADIVYEMMNSTANDRITRLMCIYKDWQDLEQVGSIRSVRPTNILVAQEYEAVICHDGGPYYINDYFSRYPYHFSGTFSRVNNGKAREFTEYILSGDLQKNFKNSGYSTEYTTDSKAADGHFQFAAYGTKVNLDDYDADGVRTANTIELPFYHNQSKLVYNEETGTYDYYEYGEQHLDADTKAPLTFENVLLQDCSFHQYDSNGYLIYNCIDKFQFAYYCTEGKNISVLWTKEGESGITHFYDAEGNELTINPGKTYIGIIPDDTWDEVMIY